MMQLWDRVRLKAGGAPMRVLSSKTTGDGTSHDGDALYCMWEDNEKFSTGWISESSVDKIQPSTRDDPEAWDHFAYEL